MTKKKTTKKSFMGVYDRPDRQYDPSVSGFGNSTQWCQSFRQRMSLDEAREVLGGISKQIVKLLGILDLVAPITWQEIRRGYKKAARKYHPDLNGGTDAAKRKMQEVNAAFTLLEDLYGES